MNSHSGYMFPVVFDILYAIDCDFVYMFRLVLANM